MTARYHRDPKTQPQIGEEVVYLPEGIRTKVIAYEWDASSDPAHPPKLKRYQLACGVTVTADHIAQGEDATPVAEKAEIARVEAVEAARKERADEAAAKAKAHADAEEQKRHQAKATADAAIADAKAQADADIDAERRKHEAEDFKAKSGARPVQAQTIHDRSQPMQNDGENDAAYRTRLEVWRREQREWGEHPGPSRQWVGESDSDYRARIAAQSKA